MVKDPKDNDAPGEDDDQEEVDEDGTQADEPGVDDLHTDVPLGTPAAGGKKKPTSLGRLARTVRQHFATGRMIDSATFERMIKQSIGATGGKGKKAGEDEADLLVAPIAIGEMEVQRAADDGAGSRQFSAHFRGEDGQEFRLLIPLAFSEGEEAAKDRWVEYLPRPGVWESPRYGTIQITAERNARFVQQFNEGVYQNQIPVDPEHETKLGGALGWIKMGGMRISPTGSVEAYVQWTDRGRKMLAEGRFKFFSPEWYDDWTDPATGKTFSDVAIGGALTTRPFFKPSSLRPIIASEGGIFAVTVVPQEENTVGDEKNETTTDSAKALSEALAEVATLKAALEAKEAAGTTDDAISRKFAETAQENKALRTMTEQMAEQVKQAGERVLAMEEAGLRREFSEMAREWPGERDAHVNLLMSLSEKPTGEDGKGPSLRDQYIKTQRAASEQIRRVAQFVPAGVSAAQGNGRGGSVVAEARSAAEKKVADSGGKISMAKAMAESWTDETYAAYLAESGN